MKKIMFLFALVYSGLLCSVEHSDPFYRDLLILQTENNALREDNESLKEEVAILEDALEELQENYDFCQIQLRRVSPDSVMQPQIDPELEDEVDEE